jgi:prepilin-type N-terminal cleavage/methylation domain-containing protein/prepilin-type processing-associated H-X9-DG protein
MNAHRTRIGFTLIELLVVIAIIAILAAILFPVFAQARAKARQTACLSNTKQLGLSFRMYSEDYDELMPVNRSCVGGVAAGYQTCTSGITTTGWVDMIQPYIKNLGILKCPSDSSPVINPQTGGYVISSTLSSRTNRNRSSYGKNNNIGNVPPPFGYTVSDAQITYPAATIMCFDWAPNQGGGDNPLEDPGAPFNIQRNTTEQPQDNCPIGDGLTHPNANANSVMNADQLAALAGTVSSKRHSEGTNYIFCDGHAKWQRPTMVIGQCGFTGTAEIGNDGTKTDFRL